jgi:hypothetical protein
MNFGYWMNSSWPEVLGDDKVLAGALLDRLLHSATVLNIQGRSYRLRDLEASLGGVAGEVGSGNKSWRR